MNVFSFSTRARIAGALAFAVCASAACAQTTLYVDASAPPGGDGLTWPTCFSDLQDALTLARITPTVNLIKVAGGTYYPTTGTSRTIAFDMVKGVTVYGGFAGLSNPWDPDADGMGTVLSGDIGAPYDYTDNSYHVVTVGNTTATLGTTIRRVNIWQGNADGTLTNSVGGGIYLVSGKLTLNEVYANSNKAAGSGGALYGSSSVLVADAAHFDSNESGANGGAVYLAKVTATMNGLTMWNGYSGFLGNVAKNGGALYADKSCLLTLKNYSFMKNGTWTGAGLGRDVAIVGPQSGVTRLSACSHISHSGLPNNDLVDKGGGVYINVGSESRYPVFIGALNEPCAFDYTNIKHGGGVWVQSGSARISYSTFWYCGSFDSLSGGGVGVASGANAAIHSSHFIGCKLKEDALGSAIYVQRGGKAQVSNTIIEQTMHDIWQGINVAPPVCVDGGAEILNCTIVYNDPKAIVANGSCYVGNSIVYFNTDGSYSGGVSFDYSDVEGGAPGAGNINADPWFEFSGPGTYYRLSKFSPCIDAGKDSLIAKDVCDLNANASLTEPTPWDIGNFFGYPPSARVKNLQVDMGAWEIYRCLADINEDGKVNEADKELFWFYYFNNDPHADMNGDGRVDERDIAIFEELYERGGC